MPARHSRTTAFQPLSLSLRVATARSTLDSGVRLAYWKAYFLYADFLTNSNGQNCAVLCAITLVPFAWKCICVLVQLHAQWRHAKSFHALFFGAVRCFAMRLRASATLELTRWRSGVRVPTSLPFPIFSIAGECRS